MVGGSCVDSGVGVCGGVAVGCGVGVSVGMAGVEVTGVVVGGKEVAGVSGAAAVLVGVEAGSVVGLPSQADTSRNTKPAHAAAFRVLCAFMDLQWLCAIRQFPQGIY